MPDPRFFEHLGPLSLGLLAELSGARVERGDVQHLISGAAPLARAKASEIAYLGDVRYLDDLRCSQAAAVIVAEAHLSAAPAGAMVLVTPEPQAAYARVAEKLHRPLRHTAGTSAIHPDCQLEDDVALAPGVVIGQGAKIGRGTEIGAQSVIGPGVAIGRNCRIGANVYVGFALIGDGVTVCSGAVIGETGFGVAGSRSGALDIPQLGRVILQDGVSIGANSCVDRGAYDDTVIGEQSKIDNLVQVGHNVQIGRNCVIAAQTGLSGSSVLEDGVMMGGGVGVADHIRIHKGARIAAAAGIMRDVPAGETWAGAPGRPIRRFMREVAWVAQQVDKKPQAR